MSPNRKRTRWIYCWMPLIIIVVLMWLAVTPSDGIYANESVKTANHIQVIVNYQLPIQQREKIYYITGVGNEILNDLEASLTITRSFHDIKNIILRIFSVLFATIDLGVFLYCLGCYIRKKKQHIPIMAISIGGHAPPKF